MRKIDEILEGEDELLFHQKCQLDFRLWAERVFGKKFKDFHIDWMELVHTERFVVVKAFRGSGKTTILGIIYPLWLCYYKPGTHILFTAAELSQATKILDEVKEEVENNEFLNELMPANPSTWKKTELKMTNGSKIFCKAYTRHIKGIHVNYAFCDEIQDCTDREVFYKAISPTVNRKQGHIVAVGATDHPADLLEELYAKPEYVGVSYPVISAPGVPRWPEAFPMDEIEKIRKRDGEASFQTQYMLNPRAEVEGALYPPDWVSACFDVNEKFIEHRRPEKEGEDQSIFMIGADFAISKGARADFDVYVVLEKVAGRAILRYAERHKGLHKDAKINRLIDLYDRFRPLRLILDPSGIGEAILQDLRQRGLPVEAGEFHSRARNKLLVNLAAMIQPDKDGMTQLVIPRDPEDFNTITFTTKLVEELISFKEVKSEATGIKSYMSKGAHDDTVMSLALACKGIIAQKVFLDICAI